MITSIITKTMDLIALSAAEREKVTHYREQLADEIAINRDLLNRFLKQTGQVRVGRENAPDTQLLLGHLKDTTFQRIRAGDLSLKRVFPDKLKRPIAPDKSDGKGTRQYLSWIKSDQSVSDLLRRFYRKVEVHRSSTPHDIGSIDIRYLSFMLRVASNSLKR